MTTGKSDPTINSSFASRVGPKTFVTVDGTRMALRDVGAGDPVVFLHYNPTSSYLWRNVVPHLAEQARCIVPDLIGHGDSAKLDPVGPGSYTFAQHRRYLNGLLDQLNLGDRVTLVVHDWGSALGFDWANRNRSRVAGIAYMEAIVRPLTWDEWPEAGREIFRALRSGAGEELILVRNLFVEAILPAGILRTLDDDELAEYRRPFATRGADRRPTLTWPRQLPLGGEPADVVGIVEAYAGWLATDDVPKLFINADPGAILTGVPREFCRTWPNQTEVTVPGRHFIQEDSPDLIGAALSTWLRVRTPATR
jgi:haloalkane dehalogenase